MATAIPTPTTSTPRDERIYHPLDRLSGIIRRYVVYEGVLSVLLFLVAWFTLVLALDYGIFEAFAWDWVQDGAWGLRATALGVALVALVGVITFRIVRRLTVEFSNSALALVLERRFPKVLGDRLITAVELADVEGAAKFGYSGAMIRKTIDEARERVGQVDVNEAFNWRRLRIMGIVFVSWVFALLVFGFAIHAIAFGSVKPVSAAWRGYHLAAIMAERNILLMDTPWPRRAHIELINIPDDGLRVDAEGKGPVIQARIYQWVIVDRSRYDGWRPLLWKDVTPELVEMDVPTIPGSAIDTSEMTADALEEMVNPTDDKARQELEQKFGKEQIDQIKQVFARLEEIAAEPSNWRTLRKLDRPEEVKLRYVGVKTAQTDEPMKAEPGNLYSPVSGAIQFSEDVFFSVRAADFRTPERQIVLVPRPVLIQMSKEEYQPACLHFAAPIGESYESLKGLRQRVPDEDVSVTERRSVMAVPIGSEVVLRGVTERPLTKAIAIPKQGRVPGMKIEIVDGAEIRSDDPIELPVETFKQSQGDDKEVERGRFELAFREQFRLTESVELELQLVNADGLKTSHTIIINVSPDQPPIVELVPKVIRKPKGSPAYWVTADAVIPFNPESNVRDPDGLSDAKYALSTQSVGGGYLLVTRAANWSRNEILPSLAAPHLDAFTAAVEATWGQIGQYDIAGFKAQQDGLERRRETLARIKQGLNEPRPRLRPDERAVVTRVQLATEVRRDPQAMPPYSWTVKFQDSDYFDLAFVNQQLAASRQSLIGKQVRLSIEATDTNYDTGPGVTRSAPITLQVVSEQELLSLITQDQLELAQRFNKALAKVIDAQSKYQFVKERADLLRDSDIENVKAKSRSAILDLSSARDIIQAVADDYRRLETECAVNRLPLDTINEIGKVANRIARVVDQTPAPISASEAKLDMAGQLRPASTFGDVTHEMGQAQVEFDVGRWGDPNVITEAAISLRELKEELDSIAELLKGVRGEQDLIALLANKLIPGQIGVGRAIDDALRKIQEDLQKETPALGKLEPLMLAKGASTKVKHPINWRQYPEDTVKVKFTASDPSITVPGEMELDFETNDLSFEYEIRAGAKDGTFTVTLTPSSGDPVEVQVIVAE